MKSHLRAALAAIAAVVLAWALPAYADEPISWLGTITLDTGASAFGKVTVSVANPLPVQVVSGSLLSNFAVEAGGHLASADSHLLNIEGLMSNNSSDEGPIASGSPQTSKPLPGGCTAKTSLPTAVGDAAAVAALCDKYGRVVSPSVLRENKGKQYTAVTGTAETTIVTADASNKLETYCLIIANTNTTNFVQVDIRDATGGSIAESYMVPPGDSRGRCVTADSGLPQAAANNNWTAKATGTSPSYTVTVGYLKAGA